jgi:hypothetical protein
MHRASSRPASLLRAAAVAALAALTACDQPPQGFAPVPTRLFGGCPAIAGRYALAPQNGMEAETVFARAPALRHVLARPVGSHVQALDIGPGVDGGLRFAWEVAGVAPDVSDSVDASMRRCTHGWLELPAAADRRGAGTLRLARDQQGWLVVAWRHPEDLTLPGWCGDHCDSHSLGKLEAVQWWRFAPAGGTPLAIGATPAPAAPRAVADAGPDSPELTQAQRDYVRNLLQAIAGPDVRIKPAYGNERIARTWIEADSPQALDQALQRLHDAAGLDIVSTPIDGPLPADRTRNLKAPFDHLVDAYLRTHADETRDALRAALPPKVELAGLDVVGQGYVLHARTTQWGDTMSLLSALDHAPSATLDAASRRRLEAAGAQAGDFTLTLRPRANDPNGSPLH